MNINVLIAVGPSYKRKLPTNKVCKWLGIQYSTQIGFLKNESQTMTFVARVQSQTLIILRPRSHDTGMKLCRLKIITFSTIHTVPVELYWLQLLFISLLKFAR